MVCPACVLAAVSSQVPAVAAALTTLGLTAKLVAPKTLPSRQADNPAGRKAEPMNRSARVGCKKPPVPPKLEAHRR
eukprot:CAMPEP_0117662520 /NCGR_PEP_ID=MMETSP0804-20121206/8095_1 /TAXON_ID=1074897 /ORGANISM="Tetraselmis astigmatica, Strain CCMP880" /LENGTH=75 /DNA_ID=CAMNT_0005469421 /DNA_START=178 /DNA_END=405 /DNA_ORIENTATION=-